MLCKKRTVTLATMNAHLDFGQFALRQMPFKKAIAFSMTAFVAGSCSFLHAASRSGR